MKTKTKTKPHFTKGRTGEVLAQIAADTKAPLLVTLVGSLALIGTQEFTLFFSLTVRGAAKCRRKQARELQRWLTAAQAKHGQS